MYICGVLVIDALHHGRLKEIIVLVGRLGSEAPMTPTRIFYFIEIMKVKIWNEKSALAELSIEGLNILKRKIDSKDFLSTDDNSKLVIKVGVDLILLSLKRYFKEDHLYEYRGCL